MAELSTSLKTKQLNELSLLVAQQDLPRSATKGSTEKRLGKIILSQFGEEEGGKLIEQINGLLAYGSIDQLLRDAMRAKFPALDIPRINPAFGRETFRKDGAPTIIHHETDPDEGQEEDVNDQVQTEDQTQTEGEAATAATEGTKRGGGRSSSRAGKTFRLNTGPRGEGDPLKINPARAGSKRAQAFEVFCSAGDAGVTYEDYRAAGGSLQDLEVGIDKGVIEEVQ